MCVGGRGVETAMGGGGGGRDGSVCGRGGVETAVCWGGGDRDGCVCGGVVVVETAVCVEGWWW